MPSDKISSLFVKKSADGQTANIQANTAPSAPPPIQPTNQNPYEFITNPSQTAKRKFLLGSNTQKSRILIIITGILILISVAVLAISLINNIGTNSADTYQALAQEQTELIRIADIGVSKATQSDAKNLATTTKLTLVSQQPTIFDLAKKAGVKTDAKSLALGKNPETDSLLTSAEQNNKFDEVFTKTLQTNLKKYQQNLKKAYDAGGTKKAKGTLSKYYKDIGNLISPAQPDSSSPATN